MGWVNKASLTLPLFTEVPVPSQESEQYNNMHFF
jgi:hypothetical protein